MPADRDPPATTQHDCDTWQNSCQQFGLLSIDIYHSPLAPTSIGLISNTVEILKTTLEDVISCLRLSEST
jgi:hypothetical protein